MIDWLTELMALINPGKVVAVILLSAAITAAVEYIKYVLKQNPNWTIKGVWYLLSALAFGEAGAFVYQLNLYAALGVSPVQMVFGIILTGVIVGGGATALFILLDSMRKMLDILIELLQSMKKDVEI